MQHIGFRIGVFYKDENWALDWIKQFKEKYPMLKPFSERINGRHRIIDFSYAGGIIILVLPATEHCSRGCRFDRVYVEPKINWEVINRIIVPTLVRRDLIVESVN